jgi:hypothetical protein
MIPRGRSPRRAREAQDREPGLRTMPRTKAQTVHVTGMGRKNQSVRRLNLRCQRNRR